MTRKIIEQAKKQFGQDIIRKRPKKDYNASGQLELDYENTIDIPLNVCIVKNYLNNNQKREGIIQDFPAKLFNDEDVDIEDYDLIETSTELFQVKNAVIKANNIIGTVVSNPAYFFCDLTYFDHDTTIE